MDPKKPTTEKRDPGQPQFPGQKQPQRNPDKPEREPQERERKQNY